MSTDKKEPSQIIRVGGREFRLYKYYEELCEDYIIDYPDLKRNPEYTDEGRPFNLAVEESCGYGESGDPEDPDPGFCSGCIYFYQEAPPNDAIGVCMCDARKLANDR